MLLRIVSGTSVSHRQHKTWRQNRDKEDAREVRKTNHRRINFIRRGSCRLVSHINIRVDCTTMPSLRRSLSVSGLCLLALPELATARVGRNNNNNGNGGNNNNDKGNGPPSWSGASAGAAGLKPLAGGDGTESILIEVIAIGSTSEEAKANAERGVRAHGAKIIPPGQLKTLQQEEAAAYAIDFNGINIFQDKNIRNNPTFEYYELAGANYLDEMSAAMNLWNGVQGSVFQGTVQKVGTGLTTYPKYSPADGATYRASACTAVAVSDLDAAFTMGWADMGIEYEAHLASPAAGSSRAGGSAIGVPTSTPCSTPTQAAAGRGTMARSVPPPHTRLAIWSAWATRR